MLLTLGDFIQRNIIGIIVFAIGVALGLVLVSLLFAILNKVAKKDASNQINPKDPIRDPKDLIKECIDDYEKTYSKLSITNRINGAKQLSLTLINDIAKSYYPHSDKPMMEIQIKTALAALKDIVNLLDTTIDEILTHPLFRIVWGGFAVGSNFFSLFKKKENRKQSLEIDLRKQKISDVLARFDIIQSNNKNTGNNPEQDKNKDDNQKHNYFVFDGFINSKIISIIKTVGEKAILIYSKEIDGGDE